MIYPLQSSIGIENSPLLDYQMIKYILKPLARNKNIIPIVSRNINNMTYNPFIAYVDVNENRHEYIGGQDNC